MLFTAIYIYTHILGGFLEWFFKKGFLDITKIGRFFSFFGKKIF